MTESPDRWLRGVCPVLEVPFDATGEVDWSGFERVVEHVADAGVTAVMFPGLASESHKLTDAERKSLMSTALRMLAEPERPRMIASVSDRSTLHAVRAACDFVAQGAAAVNLLPPFVATLPVEAVIDHVSTVVDAVDPAPVVIQHAPGPTGGQLSARQYRELAARHPNLYAVKVESMLSGRMIEALRADDVVTRVGEREDLAQRSPQALVGAAGLHMLDGLRRGAVGVQPGCSFVEIYLEVWRLWQAGQHAASAALHARVQPYLGYWMQDVELIVAVEKQISVRRGWFGSDHVRAPAYRLDPLEHELVEQFWREFSGFLGYRR